MKKKEKARAGAHVASFFQGEVGHGCPLPNSPELINRVKGRGGVSRSLIVRSSPGADSWRRHHWFDRLGSTSLVRPLFRPGLGVDSNDEPDADLPESDVHEPKLTPKKILRIGVEARNRRCLPTSNSFRSGALLCCLGRVIQGKAPPRRHLVHPPGFGYEAVRLLKRVQACAWTVRETAQVPSKKEGEPERVLLRRRGRMGRCGGVDGGVHAPAKPSPPGCLSSPRC